MIWQPYNANGVWVPPCPPAETERKRIREIRRQIVPLRCPGLAPAAWRELEQRAMPAARNSMTSLKPISTGGAVPTVSGNLIFDFDAASGVYKDAGTTLAGNGETVQQWNNVTAYATPDPNLVQATAGSRPTYNSTGGPNNLPYIASNGKFLTMTGSTHLSMTWFFVMRHITWTFGNYILSALNNHWDVRQKAASPNLRSETDATVPADITDFTLNTWMVLMLRNRSPSQSAWRAGSGTLQTQSNNGQALGLASIGAAPAGGLPSDISYARILGYDAGLDDTDTATIKGYLDGIYGTP